MIGASSASLFISLLIWLTFLLGALQTDVWRILFAASEMWSGGRSDDSIRFDFMVRWSWIAVGLVHAGLGVHPFPRWVALLVAVLVIALGIARQRRLANSLEVRSGHED